MAMTSPAASGRITICASLLILSFASQRSTHADEARSPNNARSPDDTYLDALQGDWQMTGTLLGKPVKYNAHGEYVLQGGFLRLHMIDAAPAPTYEADLFLGYDSKARDYIGHWLDRFGAAGARVVAAGKRHDETLVIEFPYAEGAFKDTFVLDPSTHTWSLLIESQAPGGAWSDFASYKLTRLPHKHLD
jgi:hypothetical protein